MEWFEGTVTEALNDYQQKQGILVVYVYAENDENSKKFDELWNSFDKQVVGNVPCIAIRLLKGSEGAEQFAQFFPTLTIPVSYILGLNAQPLEVVTILQELTTEKLTQSFKKAINLYNEQLKEAGITPNPIQKMQIDEAPKEVLSTDSNQQDTTKTIDTKEVDMDVTDEETGIPETEATKGMSKEEKLEYYKKLLEDKKKTDAIKQKEEERQKELQRRNDGKAMSESRDKQRERELRESAEARRKEKADDQAALKRIRDQLKADKEERERAKRNKGEQTTIDEEKKPATSTQVINKPINTDECKVQCRFPDGSTLNLVLPSKEPLQVVHDAVSMDTRKPTNFLLVQTYPRRKLTEMNKSLLDYELTPSSVILVVEAGKDVVGGGLKSQSLVNAGGYLQMLFGFIYYPFSAIYQYVQLFFGGRGTTTTASNGQQKRPTEGAKNEAKKSTAGGGSSSVKDGNIQRFRQDESDHSDTDATWNGNSTQQL